MLEESVSKEQLAAAVVFGKEERRDGLSAEHKRQIKMAKKAMAKRDINGAIDAAKGADADLPSNLREFGERFGLPKNVPVADASGQVIGERMQLRSTDSEDRLARFNSELDGILEYLNLRRGFDTLPTQKQNDILNRVKELLERNKGALGKKFTKLTDSEKDAAVRSIMGNATFALYVREELKAVQGMKLTSENDYHRLRREVQSYNYSQPERNEQLEAASEINTAAQQVLAEVRQWGRLPMHERGPQVSEGDAQITQYTNMLHDLEEERQTLTGGPNTGGGNNARLNDITRQMESFARQIAILRRSNQNYLPSVADLEDRRMRRVKESLAARTQFGREQADIQTANVTISTMERNREIEEKNITQAMENVFANAAYKKLLDDFQESVKLIETQAPDLKKKFTEEVIEGIAHHLENVRWRKKILRRRKGIFGFFRKKKEDLATDTEKVSQDSTFLFKRGPKALLRRVLRGVRITDEEGRPRSLTREQIANLMEDKDFVDTWGTEVAHQVIGRKQMFAGLSPTELYYFLKTAWGREMLEKARNENEDIRMAIDNFSDQGIVNYDNPTFQDKFVQWAAQRPGSLVFPKTSFRWAANGGHIDQLVDKPRPELVSTEPVPESVAA